MVKVPRHSYYGTSHRTVGMRAHLTRNLMQVCHAGRSCDASGTLELLSNRHKGALLSWSPSAAKSWGWSYLREPRHSRLSRSHESHCKWDTLFLDCANRPSLRLADTYPIFDVINTRTVEYEHPCNTNTACLVNSLPLLNGLFSLSKILNLERSNYLYINAHANAWSFITRISKV